MADTARVETIDEEKEIFNENNPDVMKLRNFRKTAIKRHETEDITELAHHSKKMRRIAKPAKKRFLHLAKLSEEFWDDSKTDSNDNVRTSESSTLTLEQFTDIVLASEGVSDNATDGSTNMDGKITPSNASIIKEDETVSSHSEGNNNLSGTKVCHDSAVANILHNKDLTVEVKPVRGKPVVLAPRHPEGNSLYQGNLQLRKATGSPTVVSVQPRRDPGQLPPSSRPHSVPHRMVEEWLQKMPPPAGSPPLPAASPAGLDLSMKPDYSPKPRQTQIFLRPISTMQITQDPDKSPSKSSAPTSDSPTSCSSNQAEIKPTEVRPPDKANPSFKLIGRAVPYENTIFRDSVKARAVRDIQMAYTKDLHGNYPIHMSVLMRKLDLVKRYCCVLQILDSTIDIFNEDQMTPLHLAIKDNSIDIVEVLLAFGADPVVKDGSGNTSIHIAAAMRSTECLKLLAENVRNRDDLNEINELGVTALHITMLSGNRVGSDTLIRHGANPNIFNKKGDIFKSNETHPDLGLSILRR